VPLSESVCVCVRVYACTCVCVCAFVFVCLFVFVAARELGRANVLGSCVRMSIEKNFMRLRKSVG